MSRINIEPFLYSISFAGVFVLFGLHFQTSKQIENLNKQIELLECYKENYLIMADSIQNIHVKCFKIGK